MPAAGPQPAKGGVRSALLLFLFLFAALPMLLGLHRGHFTTKTREVAGASAASQQHQPTHAQGPANITAEAVVLGEEKSGSAGGSNVSIINPAPSLWVSTSVLPKRSSAIAAGPSKLGLLFMSIGDWGGVTRVSQAVTAEMAMYARKHGGCSFLLSTGDNFYDSGVSSIHDPQWNTTFKALFGLPDLAVPFYSSLGNHDHRGNVSAQIAYTYVSDNQWWYLPDKCYTKTLQMDDGTSAQFFVLNSYDGKIKLDQQLRWLESHLQSSKADWKLLVNHNPIFSGGATHGATTGFGRWAMRTKELIRKLLPVVQKYGIHAMFSGDDHTLQVLEDKGIAYFVSGAGGGREKGMFHGAQAINQTVFFMQHVGGFMAHHLNRTTLVTDVVKWNGKVVHTHVLHRSLAVA